MRNSLLCLLILGCGVPVEQHVANVAESTQYGAELADCRRQGREAKKDGGAEAYMVAYEQCAAIADAKHGLTFTKDGGQ